MKNRITTLRVSFFVFVFLFVALQIQAQITITGTVLDKSKLPLPGVNIIIKGTTCGTITDFDGNFSLKCDEDVNDKVIAFSSIGFTTYEQVIGETTTFDIVLKDDLLELNEVVVTGNSNPKSKLESSVAITTISGKAIELASPSSTADLLQSIPGFMVETSGGEVGNNLFARGIPSAGAYEYVQIQEDGLPVFEDGALQFANIDNFHRVDLTVNRMEAVRGGSASIFATGAPGGIINFISKTGQNDFEGVTRLTVGDYGLLKTDFNVGGAIVSDKLFFNLGGFYRVDHGVRDPGFDANKGGQIKANLLYRFDKGFVKIFYKRLNDRNIFYQSTPFVKDGSGIKGYDGFDPNYGTFTSRNFSKLKIPQGGGGFFEANLEDGVHPISNAIGSAFHFDLANNVSVENSFKSTNINMDYNAIFAAHWMGDVSSQAQVEAGFGIPTGDATFTYDDNGTALDPTTELKRADYWFIHKDMQNFANNLHFNFDFDKLNITVGHYYSNWKSSQNWNWSSFLVSVSDDPRLVNVVDASTGTAYTYNGISAITWLQRESQLQGIVNAFYLDAEIEIMDKLTADVGLRYDYDKYSGVGDHGTWGNDIGVLPNNTADNGVNILQGDYVYWDYDVNELSYSGALNYQFNKNMASYLRYSHGFRSPIEESFYFAVESGEGSSALKDLEITKVDQTELGFKYSSPAFALFANAFYMAMDNIAYQDIRAGGVSEKKFANVRNIGIEIEAITKIQNLNLVVSGTLQKPEYDGYEGDNSVLNGNTARRIPKFYFTVRPDYNITDKFNVYAKFSYFGSKFQDIENKFELPAFGVFDAGLYYTLGNISFGFDATNILNEIGLTEADGLQSGEAPVSGQTFMGRSIFGRTFKLSATITF